MKKTLKIVAIVLAALLLVAVAVAGVAFLWLDKTLDRMNYVPSDTTVSQEEATRIDQEEWFSTDPTEGNGEQGDEPTLPIPTGPIIDAEDVYFPDGWELPDMEDQGKDIVNIMLVGQDARPGEPAQRSDSMILMTFNKKTSQITLTSFLRDQYVQIPGFGNTKLCHSYSYGGMTLLNETIKNHYGVEVDGNVTFNFEGFKDIIDMLGGVNITLTQEEATALNNLESKQKWGLEAGLQRLTGAQALRYARLRHIDSDFQRTERQRKVIMSIVAAYKNCTLSEMMKILEETMPLITTNIPKNQIYTYAFQLFPMLSGAQMETQQMPASGTFTSGLIKVAENYLASCQYNIDFATNREMLNKIFDDIP